MFLSKDNQYFIFPIWKVVETSLRQTINKPNAKQVSKKKKTKKTKKTKKKKVSNKSPLEIFKHQRAKIQGITGLGIVDAVSKCSSD